MCKVVLVDELLKLLLTGDSFQLAWKLSRPLHIPWARLTAWPLWWRMTKTHLCSFHLCPGCQCLSDSHSRAGAACLDIPSWHRQGGALGWAMGHPQALLQHCTDVPQLTFRSREKAPGLCYAPRDYCFSVKAFQTTAFLSVNKGPRIPHGK